LKLIDAFGGIAIAIVALSVLTVSIADSSVASRLETISLVRGQAVLAALRSLSERNVVGGASTTLASGSSVCQVSGGSAHGGNGFYWTFGTAAGAARVSISCVVPSP
jgi:hypothetical protein